jgi:uncharacterized protein (TIGR00369 family)
VENWSPFFAQRHDYHVPVYPVFVHSLQRVRDSFSLQALMSTLGAQISDLREGFVEIRMPFSSALTQQHYFVHAGAITSILDSACGYAAYSVAPEGVDVLSVEFKVNLLAPAVGDHFVARANVKRAGKTLTVCTADAFAITAGNEKIVATMLATIMSLYATTSRPVRPPIPA